MSSRSFCHFVGHYGLNYRFAQEDFEFKEIFKIFSLILDEMPEIG